MKQSMEQQFTKACEDYSDALFRYCFLKVSDREIAKDLVQETFMKTWSYLVKGEKVQNIRAFFYKILGNLVVDHYRKKKTVSLDLLSEEGFDPVFESSENLENKIDGEKAIKILRHIPKAYQEVIFMRYVEDMTLGEIAKITKETENGVAVKIHRGLKKIKKIYENE
jgi:RNA polymerase sigma-70 factor (ECF subfamily)